MPSRRSLSAATAVVAALALIAGVVTLLPGAAPKAEAEVLAPYQSCDQLLETYRDELARNATPWGPGGSGFGDDRRLGDFGTLRVVAQSSSGSGAFAMPMAQGLSDSAGALEATGSGSTGTNLQERGVDEPDFVKTSGDLILAITQGHLQVVRKGDKPEQLASLELGKDSYGAELLVQGDRGLVLLPQGGYFGPRGFRGPALSSRPYDGGPQQTTLVLVNLEDPTDPQILEQLELTGRYLSARLSDGAVRLVTSNAPEVDAVQPAAPYGPKQQKLALEKNVEAAREVSLAKVLPHQTRRTAGGLVLSDGPAVDCAQVRHAKQSRGSSTLLVTTLDLDEGLEATDRTAVTTDGDLVYASPDRLYVATSRWGTTNFPMPVEPLDDGRPDTSTATVETKEPTVTTELHGFNTTDPRRTTYVGSGSVDGYVLGRWALSSYEGHLRVATTSAPPWFGAEQQQSESSMTVLAETDGDLVETGRVDGMGKGERIYAVRYFGDLATVVTFRQTDPLYVLDLEDASRPKLLGELKVPGFSTYLHPVGDDQLLGIGMSAENTGRVTGLQAQLFDLSDLSAPTSAAVLPLGQNAYTMVDGESRAFGYDPERRLALLPVSQWDGRGPNNTAVGVRVGSNGTLDEVGRLEVMGHQVERTVTDDDHVYAVTRAGIVASDPSDLSRTGALTFQR